MADDPMGLADEWPAAVMPMIMAGGGRRPEDADQLRKTAATTTASKLRTVVSMLNRTGHARFRRGPVVRETASSSESAAARAPDLKDTSQDGLSLSMASSSYPSGVTGEGSVSNRRALARAAGGNSNVDAVSDNAGAGGKDASRCHCSKKRKPSSSRARARRRIRVPAISLKNADIPPDESSWRKYGQKPIKGSPYPRGYYKCSRVRGCPARKHVERDPSEPAMLIVTYERDHRHGDPAVAAVPENAVLKAIDL